VVQIDGIAARSRIPRDDAAFGEEIELHDFGAAMCFRNAETHRVKNAGDLGRIIHLKFVLRKIASLHQHPHRVELRELRGKIWRNREAGRVEFGHGLRLGWDCVLSARCTERPQKKWQGRSRPHLLEVACNNGG